MLPTFWIQAMQDGWKFSNCKIISKDGKQKLTHKILLASKSDFLRDILVDIPEGSEVVIILPDFSLNDVEIVLEKMMDQESKIQSELWEIIVKAEKPEFIKKDYMMEHKEIISNLHDPTHTLLQPKLDNTDEQLKEHNEEAAPLQAIDKNTDEQIVEQIDELNEGGELLQANYGNSYEQFIEQLEEHNKEAALLQARDKKTGELFEQLVEQNDEINEGGELIQPKVDDTDKQLEEHNDDNNDKQSAEQLESVEHNVSKNTSKGTVDKKSEVKIKQKMFQEAIEDFLSGRSTSLRQAAKKFGIPKSTLYGVFVSRGSYTGSGCYSKVFTPEEEQSIARTALEKTSGGKDLTWMILKQIMMEEMEMIKSMEPGRDMSRVSSTQGSLLSISFVRRFAERNGLSKYLLKKFTAPSRPHECEECGKTFTFKNALVKHRKTQHRYLSC